MALIGLCGNGIVVFIIASSRRRGQRSPVQLFLLHLAISDLLVCLLNIPLTIWVNFYYPEEDMAGASAVCKITRFVQVRLATQNRCNFWKLSTQNRQEFIFLLHGNGKFLQRVAKTAVLREICCQFFVPQLGFSSFRILWYTLHNICSWWGYLGYFLSGPATGVIKPNGL